MKLESSTSLRRPLGRFGYIVTSGLIGGTALLTAACGGSSSGGSAAASSNSASSATTASAAASASSTSSAPATLAKDECDAQSCNVYSSVPYSKYKGIKVGLLNIAPIPGAYVWSHPLEACLKAHGADVQFTDIGGDLSKITSTVQGFLSNGDKAVFDVGAPMAGQTSFLKQAKQNNIPVIGFDTGVTPGTITQNSDDTVDGKLAADYVIKQLGASGGTVLILGYSVQPSTKARADSAKAELATDSAVKVKYVEVPQLSVPAAQQATTAALSADPSIKAVVTVYGDYSVGAATAVKAAGSKAIVSGINGDAEELSAIATGGPLKATAANNIGAIAQLSCQTGAVMLGGGKPLGTNTYAGATEVTSANLPPAGQLDNTPTKMSLTQ